MAQTEKVEFEIPIKFTTSKSKVDSDKAADSFSKRIQENMQKITKGLKLDKFSPTGAGGVGAVAGIAAGVTIKGMDLLLSALSDIPYITATMRILKAVLVLMFLPAKDFFLTALKAMIELLKVMKAAQPKTKAEEVGGGIGAAAGLGVGAVLGGPVGAVIGAALGSMLGSLTTKFLEWWWNLWFKIGVWVGEVIGTVWYDYIVPAWEWLGEFIYSIWDDYIKPAWDYLKSVGLWIWTKILKPAWDYIVNVGEKIWTQILKPAWEYLISVGELIYLNYIKPPFEWLAEKIKGIWDFFKDLGKGVVNKVKDSVSNVVKGIDGIWRKATGKSTTKKGDFVITPSGVIESDPNDYIFGTKNPRGMGGGMTVNINIDKPTLAGSADIKTLVRAIEQELYKAQRRYVSYV